MSEHDRVDALKLRRARLLALGSWAINFACQLYGLLTSPNMKDIADENHYAFSPHPAFIGAFFSMQTVLHLWWIRGLFKATPENGGRLDAVGYVPIYALGNLCIAGWMIFWIRSSFWASQALVTVNTFAQLWAMTRLPLPTRANLITHIVAKTFAGIGVLDFIDNGAVALRYPGPAGVVVKAFTGVFFGIAALTTDPIFGVCLVYDLVALVVGQSGAWSGSLLWMAVALGAVVAVKFVVFRVY